MLFRLIILLFLSVSAKAQDVYKTPSGVKFHRADCRMVKNVSEKISIAEAINMGLNPCKICAPDFVAGSIQKTKLPQGQGNTTQCIGYTKSGNRCRHMTAIGNGYCFQHQP